MAPTGRAGRAENKHKAEAGRRLTPMPLAAALELVLNQYDIYDINDLVVILRSPVDSSQVADLIDKSRALLDATSKTAHVSVQAEPATATVGATMDSVTGATMVSSSEVQCNPSQPRAMQRAVQVTPRTMQRAVQVTPVHVATRNAASNTTISWHELKESALTVVRPRVREEVMEELEPALERMIVAGEVQATRAAKELEEARKLKEAVRAGLESQARVAAAAAADRRAAVVDRKMAAIDRAHNEGVIELLRARVKAVGDWSDA